MGHARVGVWGGAHRALSNARTTERMAAPARGAHERWRRRKFTELAYRWRHPMPSPRRPRSLKWLAGQMFALRVHLPTIATSIGNRVVGDIIFIPGRTILGPEKIRRFPDLD